MDGNFEKERLYIREGQKNLRFLPRRIHASRKSSVAFMTKLIAITMGDSGGIGPEILLQTLKTKKRKERFVVVGSGQALELLRRLRGLQLPFEWVSSRSELLAAKKQFLFWDVDTSVSGKVQVGKICKTNGAKALEAVRIAESLAREGIVSALVTAPLNKTAVRLVSKKFVGHTEFLAEHARVKKYAMMFVGSRFLVALATIHVPLKKVASVLTKNLIAEKIELTAAFLKKYRFSKQEVAVCALNPHGRETGTEEDKIILPAIAEARRKGLKVSGPHPGDSAFFDAYHGKFGAVLAMYHDQALAPFKMISFRDGVNVTLGLPYLRTSPDHGTAFDIAYTGKADPASFQSALELALRLVKTK